METEINKSISKFGIEVEFYIINKDGYPVLNSNNLIKNECLAIDSSLKIVNELSSFQIEINPGPWNFDSIGLKSCLEELLYHYTILNSQVVKRGWQLCESLMPSNISQEIINHSEFFSKGSRFMASSEYFKNRDDIVLINESTRLKFPGETIIGCINEIHIHVQLANNIDTIKLFNYLNTNGVKLTKPFNQKIKINEQIFDGIDSLELFKLANGEWNSDKSIFRVGNIPESISIHEDYLSILESFDKIPYNSESHLDLESTVYFWTRLREENGNLRVEFRPMEMGENWIERVKYLYKIIKDFEIRKATTDCQAHLQFIQPNAET